MQALLTHRRYSAWLDPSALPLLRHLVLTGAWWDHVDDLAAHPVGTILLRHRASVTPTMRDWSVTPPSEHPHAMWLRRTAILSQLTHRQDTDRSLLSDALDANLETTTTGEHTAYGKEFFIRKAVGWALRQHARVDPDWVLDYVATRDARLSGLSRREALKHLR